MIGALDRLYREQRCELLYFDETDFSPHPLERYGWTRIGQTRSVEPLLAHRQQVNLPGAARQGGQTDLDHPAEASVRIW